jgi:hypothetical protein
MPMTCSSTLRFSHKHYKPSDVPNALLEKMYKVHYAAWAPLTYREDLRQEWLAVSASYLTKFQSFLTCAELVCTVKHYFWNPIDYGFVIGFS